VLWLTRGADTPPLHRLANDPLPERDRLAERANALAQPVAGPVVFHNRAVIRGVRALGADIRFQVTAEVAGQTKKWDVERLIANVGYTPDSQLYRELQIHECYASLGPMKLAAALLKHAGGDCLSVPPQGADTLRNPEPNFYILGAKSYGRNSHFLLRNGYAQIREVFTLITGNPELDLYTAP
jgi:hypothetical protein